MSTINQISKLAKDNPNDADLGLAIRQYIAKNRNCCFFESNHIKTEDYHPHSGREVTIVKCKVCGKLIDLYED